MKQMQTLLTGFGPFGDVVSNPTERIVRCFADRTISGHALTTCVLPVSYRRAPGILIDAIRKGGREGRPFDLVWMLGVAAGSPHWRAEKYARNRNGDAPDCDACAPLPSIVRDGPDTLDVTVSVASLVTALEAAGLPAAASDNAGAFLCNHALYVALWHLKQSGSSIRVGFLHVPCDGQTMRAGVAPERHFAFPKHVRAVEATLAALAD